jgi:hypothetical protein
MGLVVGAQLRHQQESRDQRRDVMCFFSAFTITPLVWTKECLRRLSDGVAGRGLDIGWMIVRRAWDETPMRLRFGSIEALL